MGSHNEQVAAVLSRRPVLFAHELSALTGLDETRLDQALADAPVVIRTHPAPDPHLPGPLRVVSSAADGDGEAARRAEQYWARWLRSFLQSHRCC